MSHLKGMSDRARMGYLVIASVVIGIGLCAVVGWIGSALLETRSSLAPALLILLVISAIGVSAWAFIKLVGWLYRRTY